LQQELLAVAGAAQLNELDAEVGEQRAQHLLLQLGTRLGQRLAHVVHEGVGLLDGERRATAQ